MIIQVWFSLIQSSKLLYAIWAGTGKQEWSLVLYGERKNKIENLFEKMTVKLYWNKPGLRFLQMWEKPYVQI